MPFDQAVIRFSDDPSRNSGGMMINQASGTTKFESGQLDAKVFFVVDKLKKGEVSAPVLVNDRGKQDYRIYFLKERTNPHKANLQEDYSKIQQWALERKKMDMVDGWNEYRNCDFQRKWLKK
jgi:peptidyl-prolyl cis-trans isomerase SurA